MAANTDERIYSQLLRTTDPSLASADQQVLALTRTADLLVLKEFAVRNGYLCLAPALQEYTALRESNLGAVFFQKMFEVFSDIDSFQVAYESVTFHLSRKLPKKLDDRRTACVGFLTRLLEYGFIRPTSPLACQIDPDAFMLPLTSSEVPMTLFNYLKETNY